MTECLIRAASSRESGTKRLGSVSAQDDLPPGAATKVARIAEGARAALQISTSTSSAVADGDVELDALLGR